MIIHNVQQRTPEWHNIRCGKITSTSFATLANGTKAGIETLCYKTAAEILTGFPIEENPFQSDAMENGITLEAAAREAYETTTFQAVQVVGFIEMDEYIGASPDGLVSEDGEIEIKCPGAPMHLRYLTSKGKAWRAYQWQVQGGLFVSGRKWLDFVSFNPLFPPDKQLLIERVLPDDESFKKLEDGMAFCRNRIDEILKGVLECCTKAITRRQ